MEKEYDVEVEWLPFELHPEIPEEGMAMPPRLQGMATSDYGKRLRQMAQESGREIVLDSGWIPNSRRALEASEYAREQGRHRPFHDVVFEKFYGEGKDIGRWDVLRAAAVEVGLDPDDMERETESGTYKEMVDRRIAEAQQMGITGVPAYVLGNQYLIMGAQPYELFQKAMAELAPQEKQ